MTTADAGPLEDFPENAMRIVKAGKHDVGVLRWNGSVYAIRNYCPHQGGPVCGGQVGPRLTATLSGPIVDHDAPVISCGWHGWEFDARTGLALWSAKYRVKTWPARIEEGRVRIDIS